MELLLGKRRVRVFFCGKFPSGEHHDGNSRERITRAAQDELAYESHRKAIAATFARRRKDT